MRRLSDYARTYSGAGAASRDYPCWFDEQPDGEELLEEIRAWVRNNPRHRAPTGAIHNWLLDECKDRPQKPPGRSAIRRLVQKFSRESPGDQPG